MKAKVIVQVRLRSEKDGVLSERVCLVDNSRVKAGCWLTLKNSEDPKRRWKVTEVYEGGMLPLGGWNAGGPGKRNAATGEMPSAKGRR